MINILNAICETIASQFKKSPIYIDTLPQGFVRPSFYIELVNSKDTDWNSTTQNRQMTFQIMYFGRKDDFNNVSTLELYSTWHTLERLFYRTLKVTDESNKEDYKKITSTEIFVRDDVLHMTLRLEFGQIINDTHLSPDRLYELMQELNIKYTTTKIQELK